MAKENGNKKQDAPTAYFTSLTIENVKCFKGRHTIDLSDGEGKPAQWTVILGNNNTGKTTLLKCLAGLDTVEEIVQADSLTNKFEKRKRLYGAGEEWPNENFELGKDFSIGANISSQAAINILGHNSYIDYSFGEGEPFREPKEYMLVTFWGSKDSIGLKIYSFGASRKMSRRPFGENKTENVHASLFDHEDLPNMEDWLLNLFLAEKLGRSEAKKILELAKKVLSSGLLPDALEIRLNSGEKGTSFENFAEFRTDYGWIRLRDLGYGYQTMIAWVLDLVKRMVERYSDSPNPLAEPAIVLVDEIDLHLHPDWQRRIIAHLTKYFPNTQFIVTAHSPLIVQSANEVNLVILKKTADHVTIDQPNIRSFKGWTVEEILTDLMELEGQTMSNTYLDLMQQFDNALDEDNYEKAREAYDQLDKILHPSSSQRKLMKIQMTSLSPAETV